jgi:hypothetical protein
VARAVPRHGRRAAGEHIGFVGPDVHTATIAVRVAEAGRDGAVRFVGEIADAPAALDKLVAVLIRHWGASSTGMRHEKPCEPPAAARDEFRRAVGGPPQATRHLVNLDVA